MGKVLVVLCMYACRVIALDHRSGDVYLVVLLDPADAVSTASAVGWGRDRKDQILQILSQTKPLKSTPDFAAQNGSADHSASATAGHSCPLANGDTSHAAVESGLEERRLSNGHAEVCIFLLSYLQHMPPTVLYYSRVSWHIGKKLLLL